MTEHFKNFANWLNDKYLSSGSKLVELDQMMELF